MIDDHMAVIHLETINITVSVIRRFVNLGVANAHQLRLIGIDSNQLNEIVYIASIPYNVGPERVYHTMQHALDVTNYAFADYIKYEKNPNGAEVAELFFAGLFHDVIYSFDSDSCNEEDSAQFAAQVLHRYGANSGSIDKIVELIMLTQHGKDNDNLKSVYEQSFVNGDLRSLASEDFYTFLKINDRVVEETAANTKLPISTARIRNAQFLANLIDTRKNLFPGRPYLSRNARTNIDQLIKRIEQDFGVVIEREKTDE